VKTGSIQKYWIFTAVPVSLKELKSSAFLLKTENNFKIILKRKLLEEIVGNSAMLSVRNAIKMSTDVRDKLSSAF
jgi:hypothetical protein